MIKLQTCGSLSKIKIWKDAIGIDCNKKKKFCVLQKKVLSFGPNRTVEVRLNSSAKPKVRSVTNVQIIHAILNIEKHTVLMRKIGGVFSDLVLFFERIPSMNYEWKYESYGLLQRRQQHLCTTSAPATMRA